MWRQLKVVCQVRARRMARQLAPALRQEQHPIAKPGWCSGAKRYSCHPQGPQSPFPSQLRKRPCPVSILGKGFIQPSSQLPRVSTSHAVCSPCFLRTCRPVRLPPVTTSRCWCLQQPCDPANPNGELVHATAGGIWVIPGPPRRARSTSRGMSSLGAGEIGHPSRRPSHPTGCAVRSPG